MSAEWQFIVTLNEQMRPLRNAMEIQEVAIRLIGRHLQASRVTYSYVDGDEFVMSRCYADGVRPLTGRGKLALIGTALVDTYRRGETVVVNNLQVESRLTDEERANWVAKETAALVGVPLIKDGRWVASFNVHFRTPREWSPDQIALIEVAAERAWGMGERVRAEEALSRGESRQAFLRRLSDAIRPLADPARVLEEACRLIGTHLRVNRAVYGEVEGDECVVCGGYEDGVSPLPRRFSWRPLVGSRAEDILQGRTLISHDTLEGRVPRERSGLQAMGIGACISPLLVKDGRLVAALSVQSRQPRAWTPDEIDLVEEVADRIWATLEHRKAEAELRANEERLAFLLQMGDALRSLKDPVAVQETAARLLAEHLGVARAGYAEIDTQGYAVRSQYAHHVPRLPERGPAMTFGAALQAAYSRGETVVINDVASDPRLTGAERAVMIGRQMAACVTVNLVKDGQVVAAFGTSDSTPRVWTPTEIILVRDVAERTWEATERARAELAVREHEERFHRALTAAGAGYWTWDTRSGEPVWDETLRARFNLSADEAPSVATFLSRVHPDDRARLQAHTEELLQTGDRWENTYRLMFPDGTVRWMQSLGHAVKDATGHVIRLSGFELDIDDRRQTEEAIRVRRDEERDRELRLLLETATQGIVSIDSDGVIVTANHAFEEMFGWAPGDLIGRSIEDLLPPALRDVHVQHRLDYFAAPRPQTLSGPHVMGQRKDGSTFPIEFSVNHVPTLAGGRAIAFITDVTERQRAAAALQQRTAELEERTRQLSRMTWDLTLAEHHAREQIAKTLHDGLQQLLVIVALNLDVQLKREAEGGGPPNNVLLDAKHHLDEAIAAARSLSRELFPPVLHRSGLPAAMAWLANWIREKYKLDVEVVADSRADSPRSDLRTLLYESARELLFNAVKHAQADRAVLELGLDADDQLCLTVTDQGLGFESTSLDDRWKTGQVGWGLFSIRERLTLLGGRLDVESTPGLGTRVRLIAPRGAPRGAVGVPAVVPQPVEPSPSTDDTSAAQDRLRLVIVDDHAAVRNALRQMLHERPHLLVVGDASDGIDAIVQARRLRPDVILMDVMMPHMDGIEATKRIRAELPDIQILGLSMQARSETVHAIEEAGAAGFFVKGLDTQRLLDRLLAIHASRAHVESQV